jgi:hypothetical protein
MSETAWLIPAGSIPTYSGNDAKAALAYRFGPPNQYPRLIDGPPPVFGSASRVLFVDDHDDGRPVAFWLPELSTNELRRRLAEGTQVRVVGSSEILDHPHRSLLARDYVGPTPPAKERRPLLQKRTT